MSNVKTLHLSEPVLKQRLIAADLIAQSEQTREKAAKFAECFPDLESIIEALNGAKRHGYRIRFRGLQTELKAAVEELMMLEKQLCDIRRYFAPWPKRRGRFHRLSLSFRMSLGKIP